MQQVAKNSEKNVYNYFTSITWKLQLVFAILGYPYSCQGEEAVNSRQFICRMLESLRDRGWEVISGIDLGQKRSFEKTVVIILQEKSI